MPDYPARIISGGGLRPSLSRDASRVISNLALISARSISIFRVVANNSIPVSANSRNSQARLISLSPLLNIQSLSRVYFNNGFSQDSQNIYLSKAALNLPIGLNLSLEAFFVACLMQWAINIKSGDDQKIISQYLSFGDKQESYIYFTIEVTFKKLLIVVDDYETQPDYTLSPLDF